MMMGVEISKAEARRAAYTRRIDNFSYFLFSAHTTAIIGVDEHPHWDSGFSIMTYRISTPSNIVALRRVNDNL